MYYKSQKMADWILICFFVDIHIKTETPKLQKKLVNLEFRGMCIIHIPRNSDMKIVYDKSEVCQGPIEFKECRNINQVLLI